MGERDPKKTPFEEDPIVFDFEKETSSAMFVKQAQADETEVLDSVEEEETDVNEDESSPVFKELASTELPRLERENRARLLMQSPNRLYFYWSMRANPFQLLAKALGGNTGSYTLVAKLVDLTRDSEEVYQIEAEGSTWFAVDADREY